MPGRAVFLSRPSKQKSDIKAVTAKPWGSRKLQVRDPWLAFGVKWDAPPPPRGCGITCDRSFPVCMGKASVWANAGVRLLPNAHVWDGPEENGWLRPRPGEGPLWEAAHGSHLPSIFFLRAEELLFSLILKAIRGSYIRK